MNDRWDLDRAGALICVLSSIVYHIEGALPGLILLLLHFKIGWPLWPAIAALVIWAAAAGLIGYFVTWARRQGDEPEKAAPNVNPYSSKVHLSGGQIADRCAADLSGKPAGVRSDAPSDVRPDAPTALKVRSGERNDSDGFTSDDYMSPDKDLNGSSRSKEAPDGDGKNSDKGDDDTGRPDGADRPDAPKAG